MSYSRKNGAWAWNPRVSDARKHRLSAHPSSLGGADGPLLSGGTPAAATRPAAAKEEKKGFFSDSARVKATAERLLIRRVHT